MKAPRLLILLFLSIGLIVGAGRVPAGATEGDDTLGQALLERLHRLGRHRRPEWEERYSIAGRSVVLWQYPIAPASPRPVIMFSHGLHGRATQSRFLALGLAAAGYAVVAPEHRDSTFLVGGDLFAPYANPGGPMPRVWTDAIYRNRAQDLTEVMTALQADPRFARLLDWSHLGLAGHSLGGYTVLGLAGAWPSWRIPGVKAVLALSPKVSPFLAARTLPALSVPVMYQTGPKDWAVKPDIDGPAGAFLMTPGPVQLVEFSGADHYAWSDVASSAHGSILSCSRAFFDRYLKASKDPAPFPSAPDIIEVRDKP